KAFLIGLVAHIFRRSVEGEDRFRWVGGLPQRRQLERFLARPDEEVIREAKRCCEAKLTGATTRRRPLGDQIGQELLHAPPAIPEHRIAPLAYQRYRQRGERAGAAVEDWLAAEEELRGRYTSG